MFPLLSLAVVAVILSAIGLIVSPVWGVAIFLVTKPLVDTAWGYSLGGFSVLDAVGMLLPVLLLPRMAFTRKHPRPPTWIQWVALIYLASQTIGSYALLTHGDFRAFAEVWLRALNGYMGFFLFASYFRDAKTLRILLLAIILAGIFPLLMGLYQNATGVAWREQTTVGLVRKIGLYHDAFNLRFYGFQTIAGVILFRSRFTPSRRIVDLGLLLYVVAWLYVIYHVYSKAAVMIVIVWLFTWPLLTRKYHYLVLGLVLVAALAVTVGQDQVQTLRQLFSKEIEVESGESQDVRRVFAGRGYTWERVIEDWQRAPGVRKLSGTGQMFAPHNEFLRILQMNGILGLFCLLVVLVTIGLTLGRLVHMGRSPLCITAILVFEMYLVDCMGLHPGWYPSYHLFVWGMAGLALSPSWEQVKQDYVTLGIAPWSRVSMTPPRTRWVGRQT